MFDKINCNRSATVSFGFPNVWYAWYDLKASPKWQKRERKKKGYFLSLFKMNHSSPCALPSAAVRVAAPGFHFSDSDQIKFGSPKFCLLNII